MGWGGVVAYGILVSPQSQLDFGFFTSLGLGLGLGQGGQGLGLGFDNNCISLHFTNRDTNRHEVDQFSHLTSVASSEIYLHLLADVRGTPG